MKHRKYLDIATTPASKFDRASTFFVGAWGKPHTTHDCRWILKQTDVTTSGSTGEWIQGNRSNWTWRFDKKKSQATKSESNGKCHELIQISNIGRTIKPVLSQLDLLGFYWWPWQIILSYYFYKVNVVTECHLQKTEWLFEYIYLCSKPTIHSLFIWMV